MSASQLLFSSQPKTSVELAPVFRTFLKTLQERRVQTAADRALTRRIRAAVESSPLRIHGVSVYVHAGSVDVYGNVDSEERRESVLSLIADQPGAKRITDHLILPSALG